MFVNVSYPQAALQGRVKPPRKRKVKGSSLATGAVNADDKLMQLTEIPINSEKLERTREPAIIGSSSCEEVAGSMGPFLMPHREPGPNDDYKDSRHNVYFNAQGSTGSTVYHDAHTLMDNVSRDESNYGTASGQAIANVNPQLAEFQYAPILEFEPEAYDDPEPGDCDAFGPDYHRVFEQITRVRLCDAGQNQEVSLVSRDAAWKASHSTEREVFMDRARFHCAAFTGFYENYCDCCLALPWSQAQLRREAIELAAHIFRDLRKKYHSEHIHYWAALIRCREGLEEVGIQLHHLECELMKQGRIIQTIVAEGLQHVQRPKKLVTDLRLSEDRKTMRLITALGSIAEEKSDTDFVHADRRSKDDQASQNRSAELDRSKSNSGQGLNQHDSATASTFSCSDESPCGCSSREAELTRQGLSTAMPGFPTIAAAANHQDISRCDANETMRVTEDVQPDSEPVRQGAFTAMLNIPTIAAAASNHQDISKCDANETMRVTEDIQADSKPVANCKTDNKFQILRTIEADEETISEGSATEGIGKPEACDDCDQSSDKDSSASIIEAESNLAKQPKTSSRRRPTQKSKGKKKPKKAAKRKHVVDEEVVETTCPLNEDEDLLGNCLRSDTGAKFYFSRIRDVPDKHFNESVEAKIKLFEMQQKKTTTDDAHEMMRDCMEWPESRYRDLCLRCLEIYVRCIDVEGHDREDRLVSLNEIRSEPLHGVTNERVRLGLGQLSSEEHVQRALREGRNLSGACKVSFFKTNLEALVDHTALQFRGAWHMIPYTRILLLQALKESLNSCGGSFVFLGSKRRSDQGFREMFASFQGIYAQSHSCQI